MKSQLFPALALLLFILSIGLAACDDDDSVNGPKPFRVTLEVTDPGGQPVTGLELGLVPDSPWYGERALPRRNFARQVGQLGQPYPVPFSPAVSIPFELAQAAEVLVTVDDVEGTQVRVVLDESLPAGRHVVQWNSRDEAGERMNSGVYLAHLVARDGETSELLLDESLHMLFATFIADPVKLGATDQSGRLVLHDKRLFPTLYDVPDFPAMDETAERIGTISLTPTMRFYLTNPVTSQTRRYDRDVTGTSTLPLTWDP